MKTTLNKIREYGPCASGWAKLLKNLGKTQADDEPLAITTILESNGLKDAWWCLRAVDGYLEEIRQYARDCSDALAAARDAAWVDANAAARETQTNLLCLMCAEIEQEEV